MEVLVVLVITAMASAILLQALGHVLRLESRFGREQYNAQQGEMLTAWYRQSVNGLVPDHLGGANRFKGGEREFSGQTIVPLDTSADALLPVAWALRFDADRGVTQLSHGRGSAAVAVLEWPGNVGRFVYLDDGGEPHATWPPFSGKWPQLPRLVVLEGRDGDDPRTIVAAPRGLQDPLPRQRDLID